MASLGLRFDLLSRGARGAERDLERVGSASGRTGIAVGRLGKALAIGFGGAVVGGVAALGASLKGGLDEAISYQRITDQLAQTLKATGGAANVSVDQLKKYAGELESISGVDEELILNSQNVLATFTGIRNEVGKGNDIFNQASLAALNMSTTLGTDASSAAVQLGKALNDPVKGITALGKAGVSFTAQQKEQIKTLVKSGDTLGAQKIILAELNKEFGGAAAAAGKGLGGSIARLKDTFSDTFRDIATRALPTITKLADYLAKVLPGAIDKTFKFLGKLKDTAVQVFGVLFKGDFTGGGPFEEDSPFIAGLFRAREILQQVTAFIQTRVVPAYKAWISFIYTQAVPAISSFISQLANRLGPILRQVGGFLKDQLMPVFKALWTSIKTNIIPAFEGLVVRIRDNKDLFITIGKVIGITVGVIVVLGAKIAQYLIPILGALIRWSVAVIGKIIGIAGGFTTFIGKVVSAGVAVFNFVRNAAAKLGEFLGKAREFLNPVISLVGSIIGKVVDAQAKVATFVGNAIAGFRNFGEKIAGALGPVISTIQRIIDGMQRVLDLLPLMPGGEGPKYIGRSGGPVVPPPAPPSAPRRGGPSMDSRAGGPMGNAQTNDALLAEMRLQTQAILTLAGTPQRASSSARTRLAGVGR